MNPAYIEQAKELLNIQYYGITVAQAMTAIIVVMIVIFLYSGRDQRSFLGRVFDLLIVFLCIALLCSSVAVGFYFGQRYGHPAAGGFAGLFMFWFVFYIVGRVRTKIRNEKARAELAKRLQSR